MVEFRPPNRKDKWKCDNTESRKLVTYCELRIEVRKEKNLSNSDASLFRDATFRINTASHLIGANRPLDVGSLTKESTIEKNA
jgi:hypothetical protein